MTADIEGEVLGFRQWRVDDDLTLRSAHIEDGWTPGDNHAQCRGPFALLDGHAAPAPFCECGLYALHAPTFWYGPDSGRMDLLGRRARAREHVAGLVTAWGRIEVHATGFRAEHARVVAIAVPANKYGAIIARAVAAEYNVRAIPQDRLEQLAPEFGSTIPTELRPKRRTPEDKLLEYLQGYVNSMHAMSRGAIAFSKGAKTNKERLESLLIAAAAVGVPEDRRQRPRIEVPEEVRKARAGRASYDPRKFVPKRKGGLL